MIVIAHTHAEGTLVHGTARGDGWRFSHNLGADGAWYLPHSRARNADRARIERFAAALHDAGHPVGVSIDGATDQATADSGTAAATYEELS